MKVAPCLCAIVFTIIFSSCVAWGSDFDKSVDFPAVPGKEWRATKVTTADSKITIHFCLVEYEKYANEPWKYAFDGQLRNFSKCNTPENSRRYTLNQIQKYMSGAENKFSEPAGFIHHETRCGSTLVSNMIAHVPGTIMVSEPLVPYSIISSVEMWGRGLSENEQALVIHDVIMSVCHSNHGRNRCFIKLPGAFYLKTFVSAFPNTPWVFLFRQPVEVVSSHLGGQWIKRAEFYHKEENGIYVQVGEPPKKPCLIWYLPSFIDQSPEQLCVQNLSILCKNAIEVLSSNPSTGIAVEYVHLPDIIVDFLWSEHFMQNSDTLENDKIYLHKASTVYSKGKESTIQFLNGDDTELKKGQATFETLEAIESSEIRELYEQLKSLQKWISK